MYLPRTLEVFFAQATEHFPVLLLSGPRQVGKTTLLQHLRGEEREYVTLDDPLLRQMAKDEPALFLQRFPAPVLIDEIQYAPELLPHIKIAVDRQREAGMFWLTGSQQFHLMKGVTESLAGRVGVVHLLGLSHREIAAPGEHFPPFLPTHENLLKRLEGVESPDLRTVYQRIWRGSFPALVLQPSMDRDLFYGSYVQTYLQRDVRDLANVGNELSFLRFLRAAAARTGQLLNLAEMARDADVSPNTAKHWLSILQASELVYLLEPYFSNVAKRLVKRPKLYFLDTGLGAYLTEWSSPETLEAGAMSGAMLETWIVSEILKSYWHNGRRAPLYFYRDKDQKEVDLLIVKDNVVYPLECKKSAAPDRRNVKHFSLLEKLSPSIGPGGVVCLVDRLLPINEKYQLIPLSTL